MNYAKNSILIVRSEPIFASKYAMCCSRAQFTVFSNCGAGINMKSICHLNPSSFCERKLAALVQRQADVQRTGRQKGRQTEERTDRERIGEAEGISQAVVLNICLRNLFCLRIHSFLPDASSEATVPTVGAPRSLLFS